jgi:hypothetical protein
MSLSEWMSKSAGILKDFKEIIAAVILISGVIFGGLRYFASADSVIKLECGLESQKVLTIERDTEIGNIRDKLAAQDRAKLLTDFLLLIQNENSDSNDLTRFKQALKQHIRPKIDEIRKDIVALDIKAAEINKEVILWENKVAKRTCP